MVLSYLISKFNPRRKAKESSDLQHLTLAGLSSTDGGSPITALHTPAGLSWDSLDDLVEDECKTSVLVASLPPPSAVDIQNTPGSRTVTASHNLRTSPNVLPLHENTFCSISDKPTLVDILMMLYSMLLSVMKFAALSVLMFVVDALHSLFTVFVCGTAAWVVGLVTQSGFDHEAEPEDIDGASVSDNNSAYGILKIFICPLQLSYFMTVVDPNEDYIAFEPAEFYHVPEVTCSVRPALFLSDSANSSARLLLFTLILTLTILSFHIL